MPRLCGVLLVHAAVHAGLAPFSALAGAAGPHESLHNRGRSDAVGIQHMRDGLAPTDVEFWLEKRAAVLGTIWNDSTIPTTRNAPDYVEATNWTGLSKLVWDISNPGGPHPMNATGFYHPITQKSRSKVAMIVHHGHMYQNWAEVNGTGCFRATPCLMAPSPPGKPPVCHTDCRWWDLNNVTDYVHNTLEMVGDYEQRPQPGNASWFLTQANYTELYILAGLEEGRYSQQILHENDPCCFHGRSRHPAIQGYGERVEATLEGLKRPHGVFTTAIVDWNVHEWDEMSKTVVVASLALMEAGADLARFRSLPCDILYHNASAVPCPWQPPASAASEVGEQSQEMFKDDPWKVVENVDAVYGAGPHSALLGTATSVAACEDLCDKQAGCNIWTWNHEIPPHHCFGGTDPSARWVDTHNDHCTSGCRGDACTTGPAPPPPSPPSPLSPFFPRWVGTRPSVDTNKSAGLPVLPSTEHILVYNATGPDGNRNPFGVYNHGPIITKYRGLYYMSWYNAPVNESWYKRSVYATSTDGKKWTEPAVLFPMFTEQPDPKAGEENGPWTILGATDTDPGRLYTQSGTQDAGEHHEGIISVARQVGVNGNATGLGPPFWLNRTVPSYCSDSALPECRFPTYLQMDPVTRADAEQLLASFVRTLVRYPDSRASSGASSAPPRTPTAVSTLSNGKVGKRSDGLVEARGNAGVTRSGPLGTPPPSPRMVYNERSLYMTPNSRNLVLLLRGVRGGLSVSTCTLPDVPTVPDRTLFSCRPGVGDAFMNLVEVVANATALSDPRECDWTLPVLSSLPDSGSRTCASHLPNNTGVYIVGNQIDKGRDPVTLSVSRDGVTFDRHWAVRYGAPPVKYPGAAKGPGFQYPGALVDEETGMMYVSYSIGKEDIGVTRFPLSILD